MGSALALALVHVASPLLRSILGAAALMVYELAWRYAQLGFVPRVLSTHMVTRYGDARQVLGMEGVEAKRGKPLRG